MCQLPFMRMCVRSTRPPEKETSRCLPRELTASIVRPAIARSTSTRVSAGYAESNRVTVRPARARCSVRAARKIVSPSGTAPCLRRTVDAAGGELPQHLVEQAEAAERFRWVNAGGQCAAGQEPGDDRRGKRSG